MTYDEMMRFHASFQLQKNEIEETKRRSIALAETEYAIKMKDAKDNLQRTIWEYHKPKPKRSWFFG